MYVCVLLKPKSHTAHALNLQFQHHKICTVICLRSPVLTNLGLTSWASEFKACLERKSIILSFEHVSKLKWNVFADWKRNSSGQISYVVQLQLQNLLFFASSEPSWKSDCYGNVMIST